MREKLTPEESLAEIEAQIDPEHLDSSLQHLKHMFEGYRAHIIWNQHDPDKVFDTCPYSPGSARERSWEEGWNMADRDHSFLTS
jgi:ribosome modulation factor